MREAARLDQAGRCAEAEKIYIKALAAAGPPAPLLLNNAANHYLLCGQAEKARALLARLVAAIPAHANAAQQLARLDRVAASPQPGDFDFVLQLGRAAARAGRLEAARRWLDAALQLRPEDAAALTEAGLAHAASGDSPRAVFLLAQAQAKRPGEPGISLALARAAEDAGYYGDAALAYERYLQARPQDAAARRDRARALAQTPSRRAEGVKELAGYVAAHPRDAAGHFYLAQFCWDGEPEKSLALLAEAVRLDPKLAPAHVSRAWLLHRLGRGAEALPHLDAALRITPEEVRALDLRGTVLLSLDRATEAEAALRRAAALTPRDAQVALHLGRALMDQGKQQEGEQWLAKYNELRAARQRDPRREAGMIELATLQPAERRSREIERYRSMARARPDDALLQAGLAELLLEDGRAEEALAEYRRLLSLNADREAWTQAARALLAAGQPDAAKPFLDRAGVQPNAPGGASADAQLREAIEWAVQGRTAEAEKRFNQIELRWPEWGKPYLVHALFLEGRGRAADAARMYRLADLLGARPSKPFCATLQEWLSPACGK
ncbi:MAG: tetratricopeptide repeat protein [Bryobacterales bacterium]|nr:tetratricopeptide repeat protein [Bryobacterales bacterium]